jgi:hypothetical protein
MKQESLSYLGQAGVVDTVMMLVLNGDVWWRGWALFAECVCCWSLALNTPCLLLAGLETSSR